MQLMDIKIEINKILVEKGLSCLELERKMGVGRNTILSKLGRNTIKYKDMEAILKFLGKKIVWEDDGKDGSSDN
tara:strand:- start:1125 stop:1346 length:222 start_codon:yes stop_codon:yes gene_type:complete